MFKTKNIAVMYLFMLILATFVSFHIPKVERAAAETKVIPAEAIRLRILANSDKEADQAIKRSVRNAVNKEITNWVSDLTSLEEARSLIQSRLPEIQAIAERVVQEQGSSQTVKTEFGKVEFPTKLYGQFLYPAGEYEAILITLGEGSGANWWCVLFPPLCFLDFSNGVAVSEGFEEDGKKQETGSSKKQEQNNSAEKAGEEEQAKQESAKEKVNDQTEQEKEGEENKEKSEESTADQENTEVNNKPDDKEDGKEETETPVYAEEKEEKVEVKFFLVELFENIFNQS
ncbi:stage II sporulation protein R [Bacillaceae bacterium Marseille-Q3522]|nr:stage II sporulation protein R [Bacillaceae bacterium Marseille-Q3522]